MDIRNEREARERIRQIVQEVLAQVGLGEAPPYSGPAHPIATALNIQLREAPHPLGNGDGCYIESSSTILIDPSVQSAERKNFTFYHEVGHHLLRHDDLLYGFLDDLAGDRFDQAKEMYCNLFAAEFLMPLAKVKAHLGTTGFSMEQIRALDEMFSASLPALALQMAQAAMHQCIIVVCEYGRLPTRDARRLLNSANGNECLHIHYTSRSPSSTYSCSRFVPIPRGHIIHNAFDEQVHLVGSDRTLFRSGNNFPVHVDAFHYKGRVFAEFRFSDPPNRAQPTLFNVMTPTGL